MSLALTLGALGIKYVPMIISMLVNKAEKDNPKDPNGDKTGSKKLKDVLDVVPGILSDLGVDVISRDTTRTIIEGLLAIQKISDPSDSQEGRRVAYPIQGTVTFPVIDPIGILK